MPTAQVSRSVLLPVPFSGNKSGEYISQRNGTSVNQILLRARSEKLKIRNALDKLDIVRTKVDRESDTDIRKSRKKSPPYRVLLHNDDYNKREYVVQVLMKVIPGMTLDIAVNIMQQAHYNGLAVVIICAQVDAEEHCMRLRGNGLLSSIEPASGVC
eukprot:TRINITY_DN1835_c0_g1_i2.p1 TRINITY_DN1835_c0_g1~~TRINITY_DN1835_c0_g1_i2.p1  ORF type:complete len:157 (-),score=28.57 TRINITY_DN1835_c0_g1_i2:193-663(-)